jgi:hypothetical protein
MKPTQKSKSAVEIIHPSYQPTKAELEQHLLVNASFDKAVKALVRPVNVYYVNSPREPR